MRQAQIAQLRRDEQGRSERFFAGRNLGLLFEQAGIESDEIRSFSLHRTGALKPAKESCLAEDLRDLAERVRPPTAGRDGHAVRSEELSEEAELAGRREAPDRMG